MKFLFFLYTILLTANCGVSARQTGLPVINNSSNQ